MTSITRKKLIRSTVWTIVGYGASQALRFGSNLILTRLLFPELFGLMTLANVLIIGLNLLSDVGLGVSVIQSKRGDDPDFLNTIWTIQVLRGAGIWLACTLLAWPIAQLYNTPELAWLIPMVGLTILISAFNSTAFYSIDRHMNVVLGVLQELIIQLATIGVMVVWAFLSPTIWALVAGNIISAVLGLVWSHYLNRQQPNRFIWESKAAQEIFSTARWVFASTALTFVAEQSDRLMLGKFFTLEQLGVYGIALMLSELPRAVTMAVGGRIIFPSFAKLADLPRAEFHQKMLRNRRLLLLGVTGGMALMIGLGDLVVSHLYDNRYLAATWMLPILSLGLWPRLLCATVDAALLAFNRLHYTTLGNFSRFVVTSSGILFAALVLPSPFKFPGAIIAIALNDLIYYSIVSYGLWREGIGCWQQDLKATGLLAVLVAIVLGLRVGLGLGLPLGNISIYSIPI